MPRRCGPGHGKPAVVGCDALRIDLEGNKAVINGTELEEGDDFHRRRHRKVYPVRSLVEPTWESLSGKSWVGRRTQETGCQSHADTLKTRAREFGAEGIGLPDISWADRMSAVRR